MFTKHRKFRRLAAAAASAAGVAIAVGVGVQPASAATVPLPAGLIQITSSNPGLNLTAGIDPQHDLRAYVTLQADLFPGNYSAALTTKNQQWAAFSNDRGSFICSASVSDGFGLACLDIENKSRSQGARIVIRPYDGSDSQLWNANQVHTASPNVVWYTELKNVYSGLVVEAPTTADATPVQMPSNVAKRKTQQWSAIALS